MSKAIIKYLCGKTAEITLKEEKIDGGIKLTIGESLDYTAIDYIDFDTLRARARTGDKGYYLAGHTGNND